MKTLRWARENCCPWTANDRDRAAVELGYTDDFGNLVERTRYSSDDEYGYEDALSDDE